MMGRQTGDQSQLIYLFNLERRIPAGHLLRRINPVVSRILLELRDKLAPFYTGIGRPSIDPELMIRILIIGYCYGIRSERRLCEEVELHLAYRWFCRLDCCPNSPTRQIPRDVHEYARDLTRRLMRTKAFIKSRDERKRVEMRFAHLKVHHGFERMRLRGLSGARDEFVLAAIVQNLKTLTLRTFQPPPVQQCLASA